MRCPSSEIIESYLSGAEVNVSTADLEQHLSDCGACQRLLGRLVEDSPLPHKVTLVDSDWSDALADRLASRVAHATTALDQAIDLPFYVGDYELLAEIGRGGMGTVYRARQLKLNRTVAVKMIVRQFLKPSLIDRFYVEARSAAMLDHPGIVPVHDVGQFGPYVFFAMAFVSGGTLAEHTKLYPVGAARAAELLKDVAAAVQFAHERGVIHRDLKPSNILLESNGRPKVADFGLAKQIESGADLTASGEILGTPGYMPPEQAGGKGSVTTASDVYGLGAILFYLLTGRAPFEGDDAVGVIFRVVHEDPIAPRHFDSGVPLDLQTIALKCLAKRPEERYESAGEVVRELSRYLAGEPIKARPPGPFGRLARWCRRRPALAAMAFATTMAIIGGTTFSAYFGVLANQRSASLKIVNQDLAAKETEARSLALDAEIQATRATELAEKTMSMLELTLYDLQEIVVDNPAEQIRRRTLLNSVLSGLDGLSDDILDPQRLLRCRANTLLGLAEVAMELGDNAGQSGAAASQELFQQAIAAFRELHGSRPSEVESTTGLAQALKGYGDMLADAGQWRVANEYFQEALPLCERLAEASPDDRRIQALMADVEILCGEGYTHTGRLSEGQQLFQRSLERCQRMLEAFPNDIQFRTALAHSCLELGDWYRLDNNRDAAEAYFLQMNEEASKTLVSRPGDINVLLDVSTALERLGDMSLAKGDRDLSLKQYIESMEIAERAGKMAPENNDLQWDVSFGYEKVAGACLGMSKIADAKMYAHKCVDIRQRLAIADPANAHLHTKMFHALNTLTAACERGKEFDESIKWHESARHFAAAFNEKTSTNRFAEQIAKAETRIASCREQLLASPGDNQD